MRISNPVLRAIKGSRNPLGTIALLTVIESFLLSKLLAFSQSFNIIQQWALISFVIVFPMVVLSCLLWILIRYPGAVYAPSDYRTDEAFLHALTSQQSTTKESFGSVSRQ